MVHILDLSFQGIKNAIAAFLIASTEGPILIETGPYACFDNLKIQLQQLNLTVDDIKHVFITHIHLDHAGAAWAFAKNGAKVYLHPAGVKHMANPEKLWNSAKMIYGDKMEQLWGEMQGINHNQLFPINDGDSIPIGNLSLKAWHTPGHANHHIAWQLNDDLFCGDVGGVKIDQGPVVPPCPPPDIDLALWQESIKRMNEINPHRLFLTHFGMVEKVEAHLEELWAIINSWADWLVPHFERDEKIDDILPKFQRFTANQLIEKGVDNTSLTRYEAANPTWMSVAGLYRYWKKNMAK